MIFGVGFPVASHDKDTCEPCNTVTSSGVVTNDGPTAEKNVKSKISLKESYWICIICPNYLHTVFTVSYWTYSFTQPIYIQYLHCVILDKQYLPKLFIYSIYNVILDIQYLPNYLHTVFTYYHAGHTIFTQPDSYTRTLEFDCKEGLYMTFTSELAVFILGCD